MGNSQNLAHVAGVCELAPVPLALVDSKIYYQLIGDKNE
jgi:hypothetical protein